MADNIFRYIFAGAVTTALLRTKALNLGLDKRELARAFSIGFGLSESQGDEIYYNFDTTSENVLGLGIGTYYDTYENSVRIILASDSNTSSLSSAEIDVLSIVAHAIIFGFAVTPTIEARLLNNVIARTLNEAAQRLLGTSIYPEDEDGNFSQPFSNTQIYAILQENDYRQVITDINSSPKLSEVELVNYNWYDTTKVFSGPNLDLMKDSENQYYYISGQLFYPEVQNLNNFCEEETISISGENGVSEITYFKNVPCIDRNGYAGPTTGVTFYRIFNDGPYSSGDFNDTVKEAFITFDKEVLNREEYSSNTAPFYSYKTTINGDYIPVYQPNKSYDIIGEYNLTQEYAYSPMTTGCLAKYQIMRVGDARLRSQCVKYDAGICIECQEIPTSGFKFALLELNPQFWSGEFDYVLTNPPTTQKRTIKRGLNLNSSAYKATSKDGYLQTYTVDELGNENWYVGPPQLNDQDSFPYFAFLQNFTNTTFGKSANVILYPSIGTSNGSTRTFTIGSPLISGEDLYPYTVRDGIEDGRFPKAKFYKTISSSANSEDEIKLKFFGMGDSFSGQVSSLSAGSVEENAGYFYSGYSGSGYNLTQEELGKYNNYKLGSDIQEVKYISGYSGFFDSVSINKVFGNDNSGNAKEYYFFDERLVPPSVTITNYTNWSSFAPLPSGLDDNSLFDRVLETQNNENNFPRYYRGPYSSNLKSFLYPNAAEVSEIFNSQESGFPIKFRYKIEVREETVKEFYAKYTIERGVLYSPEYIPVIRADTNGTEYPVMENIFECEGEDCDFNQRDVNTGFFYNSPISGVRENWAYGGGPLIPSHEIVTININAATSSASNIGNGSTFLLTTSTQFFPYELLMDGVTIAYGPTVSVLPGYFLIKDSVNPKNNGLYTLSVTSFFPQFNAWQYRWSQQSEQTNLIGLTGEKLYVTGGIVNGGTSWEQSTPNPVLGVDDINFETWSEPFIQLEYLSASESSDGFNFTLPNKYFTENLYKENANFKQGILTENINFDFYSGLFDGLLYPTPNYSNRNLFHGYTGYELTGYLSYTKPLFNLSKSQIDKTFAVKSIELISGGCYSYFQIGTPSNIPSLSNGVAELYIKNLNGDIFYSESGQDPIYQEYLGGRRGINAENEGGYNSKEMIGDSWLSFNFRDFGYYCVNNGDGECGDMSRTGIWNPDATVNSNRIPEDDDHWFLIDVKPNKTRIHTRALSYNPMSFEYVNSAFDSFSTSPIVSFSGAVSNMIFNEGGQMFYIDLSSYMPIVSSTGYHYYYNDPSGFYLGPFDRDVEIFAIQPLSGYTQMYINNRLVCDVLDGGDGTSQCIPPQLVSGNNYTSSISSSNYGSTGYFQDIKVLAYIPSGEKCYISLKNNYNESVYDIVNDIPIGFSPESYLYVRARKTLNNNIINGNSVASADFIRKFLKISGSDFWLNNHNMTNNGMERVYEISGNIEELKDIAYSFTSFSRSGKMYPTPSSDFANYVGTDAFGFKTLSIDGVESYWQIRSAAENSTVYFSGWREGSRISFKFTELEPIYGDFPYDSNLTIIPSGNCIISGEMGYYGQADNSIFSEGFYLQDTTNNDRIKENIYGPEYVSPILKRVPYFSYLSGTFSNPVLEAPSIMRQRRDKLNVAYDQEYSGINTSAPYNYNKMLWPALSDLKVLNDEESLEDMPPDDGNTFVNNSLLISASQGQKLPNGRYNPNTRKFYTVRAQYQTYDSIATDALINYQYFVTSGFGFQTSLEQPTEGRLVPLGTTLTDILSGLV